MQDQPNHPFLEQLDKMPEDVKEKLIQEYINPVSEKIAAETPASRLESPQAIQEKTKVQLLDNLQNYQNTMVAASNILKAHDEFPKIDVEKLQQVMSQDDDAMAMPDFDNPEEFVSSFKKKSH